MIARHTCCSPRLPFCVRYHYHTLPHATAACGCWCCTAPHSTLYSTLYTDGRARREGGGLTCQGCPRQSAAGRTSPHPPARTVTRVNIYFSHTFCMESSYESQYLRLTSCTNTKPRPAHSAQSGQPASAIGNARPRWALRWSLASEVAFL